MSALNNLKSNYLLISILVIGTILRLYHINFQSVWLDEIHTLNDANPSNSISEVYASIVVADPHPPLYFYIIHFLFKIFGYTPIVARLFSVAIGIGTIYAIYRLGKELINKEVGLIASLLLAINGYNIYYSQEARPYALLCLVTTVSFFYLIKYIKKPTQKNAILYGVFATLMLYGHFFALLGLFSQFLILLFFLVISKRIDRKTFIINGFISVLVMIILFSPSYKIFLAASKIKGFWIPIPTADVYTLIYKEFFGNSEMILCLLSFITLLYVIKISKEKPFQVNYNSIIENKTVFSFIILMPWIVTVILIALIRSYVSIPMTISRYFINILPAILILLSIGICEFKNQIIKVSIIILLFIFTLTDIIVVKKYYKSVNKTQFREVTQFIIDNNKNNEPVVTSLPWYLPYFLNNDKVQTTIIDKTLDNYINEMIQDSTKIKSFWYVDGHIRPYKVTDETQKVLDEKFSIENNVDLYDIWTRHYVVSSDKIQILDISKFKNPQQLNGDSFMSNIEKFEVANNRVNVVGFAFFQGQSAAASIYNVVLIKDNIAYKLKMMKVNRPDVTDYFKSNYDVSNSGFNSTLNISSLEPGKYTVAMHIINKNTNKEGLILTDKFVQK